MAATGRSSERRGGGSAGRAPPSECRAIGGAEGARSNVCFGGGEDERGIGRDHHCRGVGMVKDGNGACGRSARSLMSGAPELKNCMMAEKMKGFKSPLPRAAAPHRIGHFAEHRVIHSVVKCKAEEETEERACNAGDDDSPAYVVAFLGDCDEIGPEENAGDSVDAEQGLGKW